MTTQIHILTIGPSKQESQGLLTTVTKDLEKSYTLVHVAHCEHINALKHVLTSLIVAPKLLVCLPGPFDEEQEEIREIANRVLPEMKLVMVPNDLDAKDENRKRDGLVEYLREQVESRFEG